MHDCLKELRVTWLKTHYCTEKDVQCDDQGEYIVKNLGWWQMVARLEEKIYLPGYIQKDKPHGLL